MFQSIFGVKKMLLTTKTLQKADKTLRGRKKITSEIFSENRLEGGGV